MTIPFFLWIALIVIGVVGSLSTFVGIIITFFHEKKHDLLW